MTSGMTTSRNDWLVPLLSEMSLNERAAALKFVALNWKWIKGMRKVLGKRCLSCGGTAITRGVCRPCYENMRNHVRAGACGWEEYQGRGLILPSNRKSKVKA